MDWVAPAWAVIMTLVLGAGAGWLVYWVSFHYATRQKGRNFEQWLEEGRARCIRVIDTDAAAAGAKRDVMEWIGELPADFNPTMFLSIDLGTGLQRAVLYEAERRGLVQNGTFERVYGVPLSAFYGVVKPPPAQPGTSFTPPPLSVTPAAPPSLPPPGTVLHRVIPADVHELGVWLDAAR